MNRISHCFLLLILSVHPAIAGTLRVPQDHKSIQAAIDVSEEGDTILVDAGTYHERLRLKPGVTLKSTGDDSKGSLGLKRTEATIIDGSFDGAKGPGVLMAEGSTIDGFTVTGVGMYDDGLWKRHHTTYGEEQKEEPIGQPGVAGITVDGVERCTVRNNIVHHIGYTGIAIFGAKDKRVSPHICRNITYRNMGGGIGSMKKSTATIEANICFENFYAGIGHDDASPLVFDNECYENVRAGIGVSDGACPIVRNNRCYKNRRAGIGIRTGEATQPIIEHNVCFENEMAGIGNRDEAQPIIRHNKCYKNRMAGIGSRDHARAVIEHNDCYENGMAGIGSRLGAAPVIRRNMCYRNKMAGIGAREGAQPVIEDNECYENLMAGIGCREDADPVVRGNRCYRNVMAGIGSRLGAHPVIVNNECFKNEMAGIGSREGAAPVIRSNHAHDNRMAGIGSRLGARPVIVDNRSLKNNMAGIGVRDSATVAVIVGNRCLENRLVAIGLPDGATGYIHGNELKRTGGGAPPIVALRGGSHAVVTDNVIHEGGVAGLLVSGTAHISGNRFLGRGPDKQGSAIWVPFGGSFDFESIVTASDNVCRGYRNLINANKSSVTAIGNTTRDFSGAALIVKRPTSPARVYGNTAISDAPGSKAIDVDNIDTAAADSNVLRKTADADLEETDSAPAWPLLTGRTNGNSFHELADSGREVVVENGPWKLVATFNKLPTFKLFNSLTDSDLKTDLSEKLDQITFRLRGKLEQKLAVEYQKSMKK